jgi:hypothetical protein
MSEPVISLDVEISRVLYQSPPEKGADYFVLLTSNGKASGKMKWRPEVGERLRLSGKWGSFKGERNFDFTYALPNVPVSPRDQLHYVCERAKGLGPAMEEDLWLKLGAEWRTATPGCVKGFTAPKYNAFSEAVALMEVEADKSQAIAWLMSKHCSVNMSTAAWEQWEKQTIGVVQGNVFRLADLPHYSFVDVDGSIREAFGIGDDDPRRIRAAVLYKLRALTSSGSTVIDWDSLYHASCQLVGGYRGELIAEEVSKMFEDGNLKGFTGTRSISLGQDYKNELDIWAAVGGVE